MIKNNNGAVVTRMAKRSLNGHKVRNGILILAVTLSVFLLFTVLTVGETWLRMQRVQNIRLQGGDFDAWLYGGFTEKQREICENNPDIAIVGVEGMAGWGVRTEYDSTLHSVFVWSDENTWKMKQPAMKWIKGSYPEHDNEVMTTETALKDCGLEGLGIGDSFTITYQDNNGEHTGKFTISGLWDGYANQKTFYVSRGFFEKSGFSLEDLGWGFLYVKYKFNLVTGKTLANLENDLALEKKQALLYSADTARSVLSFLGGLLGIIAITSLSAYLLIYNIMYLSVSGNVRRYGLLQTIGMTGKQVNQYVKKQMLFLGAAGIGAGLFFGIVVSFAMIPKIVRNLGIHQDDIPVTFHPLVLLLCILIAGGTIYLGSVKPARMAMKVSPIEALKYQAAQGRDNHHPMGKGLLPLRRRNKSGNRRFWWDWKDKTRHRMLLWDMAAQHLGKDRKKTISIVAALGICLSFFLCVVTLVLSEGPRTFLFLDCDLEIKNDTMQMENKSKWKRLLDDSFLEKLQDNQEIKEIHSVWNDEIVIPWEPDFMEYWMENFYDYWMEEEYNPEIQKDYQKNPEKYDSFLVGIDQSKFETLNASLESPVLEADFLAGKVCILYQNGLALKQDKVVGKTISYYLLDNKNKSCQMTIGGMTDDRYYSNLLGTAPTLIVSDTFLKSIAKDPYVSKVSVSYQKEYDQATEDGIKNMMEGSPYHKDFAYDSKIEGLENVKQAQGNIMEIGIGITLILAFIGIMNYINVSVGDIQSREMEFSIMESIGMTGWQLRKMLICEGILFAAASLGLAMTVGLGITYCLYQAMNYRGVAFTVPLAPMGVVFGVILLLCIIIPLAEYGRLERSGSIVERLNRE